jgi:hypothetical protein
MQPLPGDRAVAWVAMAVVAATACSSPSQPSSAGYAGQWSGRTAQGKAITFTVSPDERVTAITVGHEFNGCSSEETFANLSIGIAPDLVCIPGPCPASAAGFRSFSHSAGDFLAGRSTTINGLFTSSSSAEGSIAFRNFGSCGTVIGVAWTATRR